MVEGRVKDIDSNTPSLRTETGPDPLVSRRRTTRSSAFGVLGPVGPGSSTEVVDLYDGVPCRLCLWNRRSLR